MPVWSGSGSANVSVIDENGGHGRRRRENGHGHAWRFVCGVHCVSQRGGDLWNKLFSPLSLYVARRMETDGGLSVLE